MENKRGRPYTAEPGMRSCLPYAFPGNRPPGQGLSWARGAASKGTPKNTQSLEKACGSYYLFRHLSILQYLPSPESRRYFLPRILWGNFLVQVLWEREQSVKGPGFSTLSTLMLVCIQATVPLSCTFLFELLWYRWAWWTCNPTC